MIAFMTIIYTAVVVLVFFVFKVKPRPYPVALTVVAGVLMLAGVVIFWLPAAPISKRAVVSRYVVQLVPYVKGQVVSIPAQPNVPLRKGDVLYEIDRTPYQFAVDLAKSQLEAAKSNVAQAEAAVKVAEAAIDQTKAALAQAKSSLDVAVAIKEQNPAAIAKLKLDEATNNFAAAQASLQQAEANVNQKRAAVITAKDGVATAQAQLQSAQFNLQECTVRAPADGFITDWQIREGTFVTPIPMAAAGTFIDTSETNIVASFPANLLTNVEPGQEVELAFQSHPGWLFLGQVENVIQASGEGQFTTGGKLPSAASVGSAGMLAVKIRLNDPALAHELPMGAAGTVAIYTDKGKPFQMISKVTIRMQKWLYYLPLPPG